MSSGKIAVQLAEKFYQAGWDVTSILTKSVKHQLHEDKEHLRVVRFETTDELLRVIQEESKREHYDVVIHSAAVADYKPEFSFRMEDMATKLTYKVLELTHNEMNYERLYADIFATLTNPNCKVNDDTKISSCEPNLTVKLGLTPKIIASLRDMFPDAYICGFKLLENVPEAELVEAAVSQIKKCKTDMCFANDLAELRKGSAMRLVVTGNGYNDIKVDGAEGIFNIIKIATEN